MADAATERRLGNLLLAALNMACDQKDLEVARMVHRALELVMTRSAGADNIERRDSMAADMRVAYERIRGLEHALDV
jgi:hypothetical protein